MRELAIAAARRLRLGSYQRDVLIGRQRLSGADLRGKARRYGARYAASRESLLKKLDRNSIPHHVAVQSHGKLVLVMGVW